MHPSPNTGMRPNRRDRNRLNVKAGSFRCDRTNGDLAPDDLDNRAAVETPHSRWERRASPPKSMRQARPESLAPESSDAPWFGLCCVSFVHLPRNPDQWQQSQSSQREQEDQTLPSCLGIGKAKGDECFREIVAGGRDDHGSRGEIE